MRLFFGKDFNLGKLSTVHEDPTIFIVSQWQEDKSRPNIKYLLYRTFHALYLLTTWILSLEEKWYVFMSTWGYTILMVQSMICWIMLIVATIINGKSKESYFKGFVSKSYCVYWAIHSAANATGLFITIIYWTAVYGPSGRKFTASIFFNHVSNAIAIILDLGISAHPVHLSHCIYPLIFNMAYFVYTIAFFFYYKARGRKGLIYDFLDWNYPGRVIVLVIGTFFSLVVLHVLTYLIYKLRVTIFNKLSNDKRKSQEEFHNSDPLHI